MTPIQGVWVQDKENEAPDYSVLDQTAAASEQYGTTPMPDFSALDYSASASDQYAPYEADRPQYSNLDYASAASQGYGGALPYTRPQYSGQIGYGSNQVPSQQTLQPAIDYIRNYPQEWLSNTSFGKYNAPPEAQGAYSEYWKPENAGQRALNVVWPQEGSKYWRTPSGELGPVQASLGMGEFISGIGPTSIVKNWQQSLGMGAKVLKGVGAYPETATAAKVAATRGARIGAEEAFRNAGATVKKNVPKIAVQASTVGSAAIEKTQAVVDAVKASELAQKTKHLEDTAQAIYIGAPGKYIPPKYKDAYSVWDRIRTAGTHNETMIEGMAGLLGVEEHAGLKSSNAMGKLLADWYGAKAYVTDKARTTFDKAAQMVGLKSIPYLSDVMQLKRGIKVLEQHPDKQFLKMALSDGKIHKLSSEQMAATLNVLRQKVGQTAFAALEQAMWLFSKDLTQYADEWKRLGIMSAETIGKITAGDDLYLPLRYMANTIDGGADTIRKLLGGGNSKMAQTIFKRLMDAPTEGVMENPFQAYILELMARHKITLKNKLLSLAADLAESNPKIRNILNDPLYKTKSYSYLKNGVKQLTLPEDYVESFETLFGDNAGKILPAVMNKIAEVQEVSKAGMVRYNPGFWLVNLGTGIMNAWSTQGILPTKVAQHLIYHLSKVGKVNPKISELYRLGGGQAGLAAKDMEQSIAKGNIVIDMASRNGWQKFVGIMEDINGAFENASRTASIEVNKARGFSEDVLGQLARNVDIDYKKSGWLVKGVLNPLFIFLNPAIRGTLLPINAAKTYNKLPLTLGALTGLLAASDVYNKSFPEYKDVPLWVKTSTWHFMIPYPIVKEMNKLTKHAGAEYPEYDTDGHKIPYYISIIPAMREYSAIQGIITQGMDTIDATNAEWDQWAIQMIQSLSPISGMFQVGNEGAQAMIPTQAGRVGYMLGTGKSPWTGKDMVPSALQELPKSEQYYASSSMLAKRLGQLSSIFPPEWQISPIMVDGVIREMFGGAGQDVVRVYSLIDKAITGFKEFSPEVQRLAAELKSIQFQYSGGEIREQRDLFLSKLDKETRKQVESCERMPAWDIPVVSNIIKRYWNPHGGGLDERAERMAMAEYQKMPTIEKRTEDKLRGAISRWKDPTSGFSTASLDKVINEAKIYQSGWKGALWAKAEKTGALPRSEKLKHMPEGYGLTTSEKALNEYYQKIEDGVARYSGSPTSKEWSEIWDDINTWMMGLPSNTQAYIKANQNTWLEGYPQDLRDFMIERERMMQDRTWWDRNYSGSPSSGPTSNSILRGIWNKK